MKSDNAKEFLNYDFRAILAGDCLRCWASQRNISVNDLKKSYIDNMDILGYA